MKFKSEYKSKTTVQLLAGILLLVCNLCITSAHASMSAGRDNFGRTVANLMTFTFNNSSGACSDEPLYECRGLMVSAFENDQHHPDPLYWARSGDEINKLSMTFIYKDNKSLLFGTGGFVMWPEDYVDSTLSHYGTPLKPVYRCAYPFDGETGGTFDVPEITGDRSDHGCGERFGDPDTAKCRSLGITSVEQWWDKYKDDVAGPSCAFDLTQSDAKQVFDITLGIRKKYQTETGTPDNAMMWNEVILQAWKDDTPSHVPVMAFFILDSDSASKLNAVMGKQKRAFLSASPETVRTVQEKYYELTKIFVPIITISGWPDNATFTYTPSEQSTSLPETVNVLPE
ncbi:hypothetical protein FOI36_02120 [Salmonella enterica]|uniref:Uncharacterized protein n=1 Tax=Salmonella enterica subsp. salamae TaxID=59202 RepID=A0A5Y1WM83_SALER|nr:hypothetical protein [Salmonella enterica]EBS3173911.1 hypothetical protein [Salmonella enterica subsp. enterica serovar Newport]ECC1609076.1 hypothetical protein [Salmonella enterica subsp. salamae]HAE4725553.1 hypothetical protein [Salmonella enterica subsp. salamae serovar 47:a:1,5]EAR6709599.1 hypothetical protein [Salmonella enterica]